MHSPVFSAFVYLALQGTTNRLWQRLRRLRQPKYALGALAGLAYVYFLLLRPSRSGSGASFAALQAGIGADVWLPLAACFLLLLSLYAWIFPRDRAALRFSEAEVAFLLPAPVARRTLIHLKLLRSQFGILFAVLILSLVFRSGESGTLTMLMRGVGWWLILSSIQLHFIAVSFARERLLGAGIGVWPRRLLVIAVLAVLLWQVLQGDGLPPPRTEDLAGMRSFAGYLGRAIDQAGLLSYLLWPLRWLLAPYFAADGRQFLLALGPAVGVLLAHYLWVIRADVAFEEASIAEATRHAERMAALRSGNLRLGRRALKPRSQPWQLAAHGPQVLAYLWKGLIEFGSLYRLRNLLLAAALPVLGLLLLSGRPAAEPVVTVISALSALLAGFIYLFGPVFVLRGAQQLLQQLDIAKSHPVAGWQLVLGQLLPPLLLICCLQALLLWTSLWGFALLGGPPEKLAQYGLSAVFALIFLTPPLVGLLLCVPMAGALYFPAWVESINQGGGGIERGGQQILFFAAYFLALALALLPALLVGGLLYLPIKLVLPVGPALLVAALVAAAVLLFEFVGVLQLLGRKLDDFDLALELPR